MNRFSNENSSYTTRDYSKQGKQTADYRSNPDGKGPTEIKIRLEP